MRSGLGGVIAWCVVSCGGDDRTTVPGDGRASSGQDSGARSSLFIQSVLYRRPPQCVVTADATTETLGSGTLDLAFTKSYVAALLVGSQLTSRITLRGADINLTDSTGNSVHEFSVNGTGSVDASRGGDSGLGTFDAELVPASIADKLLGKLRDMTAAKNLTSQQATKQVVALVRVFGATLGNEDVTSSEFSFPIAYCEGCLVRYPLTATNPQTSKCINSGAAELPVAGCKAGQDDPIDCRACASTKPLCENVPAN
jgi:hypothetical protein